MSVCSCLLVCGVSWPPPIVVTAALSADSANLRVPSWHSAAVSPPPPSLASPSVDHTPPVTHTIPLRRPHSTCYTHHTTQETTLHLLHAPYHSGDHTPPVTHTIPLRRPHSTCYTPYHSGDHTPPVTHTIPLRRPHSTCYTHHTTMHMHIHVH